MTDVKPELSRWAVSKSKNKALSRPVAAFEGSPRLELMSNAVRDLSSEAEVVVEIDKLWREAQEKFLAIGRYLVQAKLRFHRTFEAEILGQLPFGKNVAYQLRAVAVAVDEGRILEEEMPRSYATAYQLVSLRPDTLEQARKENLVRPDVLRREVQAFKERVRESSVSQDGALAKERTRLRAEAARIARRLEELDKLLDK